MTGSHAKPGLTPLDHAEWLHRAETQAVFRALAAGGFEARAVGGAVRNALMGLPVKDVDIATTARPEDTMRLAEAAGLAPHPTGLAHGTVTVVSNHVPYEVTTLRRDAETFGRHARVAFTDDWAADAGRRDFTINALYCNADGTLFDPLAGLPDLLLRRVRFIGNPHERIREDYLRILRFFRFSADYSNGALDAEGLTACREERDGLTRLSGERIRSEMLRLLAAPAAPAVIGEMSEGGLLEAALGQAADLALFMRLVAIEAATNSRSDPLLRLGVLAGATEQGARHLTRRLKLSNEERDRLVSAGREYRAAASSASSDDARAVLYQLGASAYRDAISVAWARSGATPSDDAFGKLLSLPDRWTAPQMPFRGADLVALGLEGPAVGKTLAAFEAWWIRSGFPSDAATLDARLASLVAAHTPSKR